MSGTVGRPRGYAPNPIVLEQLVRQYGTAKALAKAAKVHDTRVSEWRHGKGRCSMATARQVCEELGVQGSVLFPAAPSWWFSIDLAKRPVGLDGAILAHAEAGAYAQAFAAMAHLTPPHPAPRLTYRDLVTQQVAS